MNYGGGGGGGFDTVGQASQFAGAGFMTRCACTSIRARSKHGRVAGLSRLTRMRFRAAMWTAAQARRCAAVCAFVCPACLLACSRWPASVGTLKNMYVGVRCSWRRARECRQSAVALFLPDEFSNTARPCPRLNFGTQRLHIVRCPLFHLTLASFAEGGTPSSGDDEVCDSGPIEKGMLPLVDS